MKIVQLKAENIKKLRAVEITPDGNVVKISGRNAQGKTSTLDSIWWALGGEKAIQGHPIRDGEDKARITLDLGDIVVERRFTQKGSTLTVSNKDGAKFSSPQKMLDDLVGRLTFDPLAFMRMEPKKQAETLRDLAGLDFTQLDSERKETFDERTLVNRQAKDLKAQLDAVVVPEGAPEQEVDVAELAAQLSRGNEYNRSIDDERAELNRQQAKLEQVEGLIAQLRRELDDAEHARDDLRIDINNRKVALESKQPVDLSGIQSQIENAKAINDAARARQDRQQLSSRYQKATAEADRLTERLKEIDTAKADMIRSANLPVPGLGFDEDGNITFNGVPLDQASGAEQLRVSVAMAMSLNPKLRVLRITDASLLDSTSWKVIEELASDGDYQVWAECVDESGKVGIYIEDGQVAAVNGEPVHTPDENGNENTTDAAPLIAAE